MGNLNNSISLITARVKRGEVNEKALYDIFASDSDFSQNEDEYQYDTLDKGFENEADRQATEIWVKYKNVKNERERLFLMMDEVFKVSGFIGNSSYYGNYSLEIIETDTEFIIIIGVIM